MQPPISAHSGPTHSLLIILYCRLTFLKELLFEKFKTCPFENSIRFGGFIITKLHSAALLRSELGFCILKGLISQAVDLPLRNNRTITHRPRTNLWQDSWLPTYLELGIVLLVTPYALSNNTILLASWPTFSLS